MDARLLNNEVNDVLIEQAWAFNLKSRLATIDYFKDNHFKFRSNGYDSCFFKKYYIFDECLFEISIYPADPKKEDNSYEYVVCCDFFHYYSFEMDTRVPLTEPERAFGIHCFENDLEFVVSYVVGVAYAMYNHGFDPAEVYTRHMESDEARHYVMKSFDHAQQVIRSDFFCRTLQQENM